MGWREFVSDINLIWTTIGLTAAGLGGAFMAGRWWSRRALRTILSDKNKALAEKDREIAELNRRIREHVPQPTAKPPAEDGGLPPESVQVWLKSIASNEAELSGSKGRIPTLLIANLKGGVAKTMVAANLAAYFARRAHYGKTAHLPNKRVLLIDLDYQGSLSGMVLTATNAVPEHSNCQVKTLFDPRFSDEDAFNYRIRPQPTLPGLTLYPATYGFDDLETREQFRWLAGQTNDDVRFRLLRRLRSPSFTGQFDLVIMDTGPRLTTGSVAALVAATHLLIPTGTDHREIEATERFMRRVSVLKRSALCPNLTLAGVVATRIKGGESGAERRRDAVNALQAAVEGDTDLSALISAEDVFLASAMPSRQPIVNEAEASLPYLASTSSRTIFNAIGLEVEQRMS